MGQWTNLNWMLFRCIRLSWLSYSQVVSVDGTSRIRIVLAGNSTLAAQLKVVRFRGNSVIYCFTVRAWTRPILKVVYQMRTSRWHHHFTLKHLGIQNYWQNTFHGAERVGTYKWDIGMIIILLLPSALPLPKQKLIICSVSCPCFQVFFQRLDTSERWFVKGNKQLTETGIYPLRLLYGYVNNFIQLFINKIVTFWK